MAKKSSNFILTLSQILLIIYSIPFFFNSLLFRHSILGEPLPQNGPLVISNLIIGSGLFVFSIWTIIKRAMGNLSPKIEELTMIAAACGSLVVLFLPMVLVQIFVRNI